MNAFVGPRADARDDEQVDPAYVVVAVVLDELQRAVHATGLVSMHSPGDEREWKLGSPATALDRELRIAIGRVVELPVGDDIEPRAQAIDHGEHVRRIAALDGLQRSPSRALRIAPRLAW